jgi:uncharacterized membrane protein YcaP (DUF421 family)
MAQLEAAARKQGFDDLSDVNKCILEPGGTLTFIARKPDTESTRHQELMLAMEKLREEVTMLRNTTPPRTA